MQNPFDPAYLTTVSATLGPLAWAFLALQAVGVGVGVYLRFFRQDSNVLRKTLLARLGMALLIVGGVGLLLGVLRSQNVPVFNQRYWFYLLLLAELGLAGYVAYYARRIYPQQLAQSQTTRGKSRRPAPRMPTSSSTSTPSHNGHGHTVPAESVQNTSRRSARQRRKRKQK